MLKGFFLNNPTMNYGSSKSAKIVPWKSIFYVKNGRNFFKKRNDLRISIYETINFNLQFHNRTDIELLNWALKSTFLKKA